MHNKPHKMLFKPIQNFSTFNNRIPTEKLHNKNNLSITKYHSKKYINFPPHYLTNSTKMSFFFVNRKKQKIEKFRIQYWSKKKNNEKAENFNYGKVIEFLLVYFSSVDFSDS